MEDYNDSRLAIAAATIAADSAWAAKLDPPAAYQDLDSPATAISGRGRGFRGPQLMAFVPRCANVAIRIGVAFHNAGRMAFRYGRYLNGRAPDEEVEGAAEGAAYFQPSIQMAKYRINACDVEPADTRRAM